MTSKFSRAALVAGLAIAATGLVAVPAEAANGISTANYYVNNPTVAGASNVTPESAVVSGAIDTGGNPESLLPVGSSGLLWSPIASITIAAEKWNDASDASQTTTGNFAPIDGIPASGSGANVSVTITDPGIGARSATPQPISNAGADNYSDVTFEYDPVSDYDATDGQPGPNVQFAQDVQVPTTSGISSVATTLGAFGQAAQNNSGNTPLTPGTKYYYWIVQQAGGTDAATNINVSAWTNNQSNGVAANNAYKCYPNVAILADPTLTSYTLPNATVTYGGQTLPASQGPCIYYYGNTGGALYYQSPTGTFATPALGKVAIAPKATATAKGADVTIADLSAYRASGTVALTVGGKVAGIVKFGLQAGGKRSFKVALTAKGKAALRGNKTVKVAPVSQTANVASLSKWDQPLVGKAVKL